MKTEWKLVPVEPTDEMLQAMQKDLNHVTRLQAEIDRQNKTIDGMNQMHAEAVEKFHAERDALKAEVELLTVQAENDTEANAAIRFERDHYKSELTKALDLVRWLHTHADVRQVGTVMMDSAREFIAHQSAPAANPVFNDPLYNAKSDARNATAMLEEVLEFFDDGVGRSPEEFKLMRRIGNWLGRSAPAAKDGSDE